MIRSTRISRLLHGYRDRPAADLEAITLTLLKLSQLISDLDRVVELDINPLLADASGVMALDARIVIRAGHHQRQPLAIRPYPKQLEQSIATRSGQVYSLRPIRPEDEAALVNMLGQSSPSDVRLRFCGHQEVRPCLCGATNPDRLRPGNGLCRDAVGQRRDSGGGASGCRS